MSHLDFNICIYWQIQSLIPLLKVYSDKSIKNGWERREMSMKTIRRLKEVMDDSGLN
jgi:hypothetical protein